MTAADNVRAQVARSNAADVVAKLLRESGLGAEQIAAIGDLFRCATPDDLPAILAVARVRQAMPAGIDAIVRVLEFGARKHNGDKLGIAPWVTAIDCAEHLAAHAEAAEESLAFPSEFSAFDTETEMPHAAHAGARAVMLCQILAGEVLR